MKRLYVIGNLFFIQDADGNLETFAKSLVLIKKDTTTATLYSILFDNQPQENIEFSNILDINGAPYQDQGTFDDWISINTGFNAASGGSGAGFSRTFSGGTKAEAETARDTFFTNNPTELRDGLQVAVIATTPNPDEVTIQVYSSNTSSWIDLDTVLSPAEISTLLLTNPDWAQFTPAEKTKLAGVTLSDIENSFSSASIVDGNITFARNSGTGPQVISIPIGVLSLEDVPITSNLNISSANLATYRNRTIINRSAGLANIDVTLDSLATLRLAAVSDFFITFINESSTNVMRVEVSIGDSIAQRSGTLISLNQGESITLKYPSTGTRWFLVANTVPTAGTLPPGQVGPTSGTVIIQVPEWDPTGPALPSATTSGQFYKVSTAGTFDGEYFDTQDLLLAVNDNPSTTTLSPDWRRVNGDEYVHSWGGLTGIIDDSQIRTVLERIGFVRGSGAVGAPSVHNFSVDIPSQVPLGTNLNNARVFTFDITNRSSIQTLEAVITGGNNVTLVNPTRDGLQTQSVTLSGINTTIAGTITMLLRITDTQGNAHDSNTITIRVQDSVANERIHFGFVLSTEDQEDVDFETTDIESRDALSGSYTVSGIPDDGDTYRLYWAVPSNEGSVTRVSQGGFTLYDSSLSTGNQFTNFTNVNIDGSTYNILLMNAVVAVNNNYNGTVLTIS